MSYPVATVTQSSAGRSFLESDSTLTGSICLVGFAMIRCAQYLPRPRHHSSSGQQWRWKLHFFCSTGSSIHVWLSSFPDQARLRSISTSAVTWPCGGRDQHLQLGPLGCWVWQGSAERDPVHMRWQKFKGTMPWSYVEGRMTEPGWSGKQEGVMAPDGGSSLPTMLEKNVLFYQVPSVP